MATNELQQQIQDHFEDPYHRGRCDYPTHVAEADSACPAGENGGTNEDGTHDLIAVELRIEEDRLREIWFDGRGCILSVSIASMLAEKLEGQRTEKVLSVSLETAMSDLNVKVDDSRKCCCHLALRAIKRAIQSETIDTEDGPTFGGPDLGDEC